MQKEQQQLAALIKGKKVAFIGAGVSHKALIKEFVELGAHVTLCDQKKSVDDFGDYAATIRELGIDLSLGENYLEGFKGQDIIMRTPGFVGYFEKPLQDAMAAGTMVTSEVELFFDFCPCEIVGVTGSDGKTTTTTLISKFYEACLLYTSCLLQHCQPLLQAHLHHQQPSGPRLLHPHLCLHGHSDGYSEHLQHPAGECQGRC